MSLLLGLGGVVGNGVCGSRDGTLRTVMRITN
jgi:hypothetical protein